MKQNHNQPEPNREKLLDQIIDGTLAHYASINAEPRAGLEDRILANVRAQPAAGSSSWFHWKWMAASAIAAVLLIAVILFPWKQQRQHLPIEPSTTSSNSNSVTPREIQTSKTTPLATTVAAAKKPTPSATRHAPSLGTHDHDQDSRLVARQPVFPSPAPPSEQELLLLRYVRQTPQNTLVALSKPEDADQLFPQMNELQRSLEQKSGSLEQKGNSK